MDELERDKSCDFLLDPEGLRQSSRTVSAVQRVTMSSDDAIYVVFFCSTVGHSECCF